MRSHPVTDALRFVAMKMHWAKPAFTVGAIGVAVGGLGLFFSRPHPAMDSPAVANAASPPAVPGIAADKDALGKPLRKLSFNDDIQPILSEHCFQCHGPDSDARKGELRLDRPEQAFLPRKEGGAAIVKHDPANSLIIRRISSQDPTKIMPPPEAHKPLREEQIAAQELACAGCRDRKSGPAGTHDPE